jgi:hypothetical protein
VRKGRPWSLPLTVRTAATGRRLLADEPDFAPVGAFFGVSKSAADHIVDHLGPALALQQRKRFRKGTVLIVNNAPGQYT